MILICGASGLVGKEMCNYLDLKQVNYIGTYNKNIINKSNMFKIDFSNHDVLEKFLILHKITSCIFCIVERLTDVCENNWNIIKKTNIDLAHITSYICNKLNIKFIHLSTDYVFDGLKQPNLPDNNKNPLQNYGISKLMSEYRVINNCKNYCIIRTPVLYTPLSKIHENAVCLIGKNIMDLRKNKYFKEDNYCIRRPLFIPDLCNFIYDCIYKDFVGIYHFYNPTNKFTKYEICKIIGNYLEINLENIEPNNYKSEGIAPRPYDTQLLDNNIKITEYKFKDFDETIKDCFKNFKHPKLNLFNKNDFFILLDMDGTIIDSNLAHYNAYKKVFDNYKQKFMNLNEWNNIILNDSFNNYLYKIFDEPTIDNIKNEKINMLKEETITFTKNSEQFLNYLIENNFNFCIVTNTYKETIENFKEKLPILSKITQWISREDYTIPKPNSECFELAKQNFYKGEKYILGIEDSSVGYHALKSVTDLIYIYKNEILFQNNDCFLFDDYSIFLQD